MSRPVGKLGWLAEVYPADCQLPDPLPAELSLLAVPGEALDQASHRTRLQIIAAKVEMVVTEMIPAELMALLPEQNQALKLEFGRLFRSRCRYAAALRAREVTLPVDWRRLCAEPLYREQLQQLLRGVFGILDEWKLRLRLEWHYDGVINAQPPCPAPAALAFVKELMFPGVGLAIHAPPEPRQQELPFRNDFHIVDATLNDRTRLIEFCRTMRQSMTLPWKLVLAGPMEEAAEILQQITAALAAETEQYHPTGGAAEMPQPTPVAMENI